MSFCDCLIAGFIIWIFSSIALLYFQNGLITLLLKKFLMYPLNFEVSQ